MENELREILLQTAASYAAATCCAISTISRRVKNNPQFFSDIKNPDKSFTARTFDEVMRWFADNWPVGTQIPLGLMKWMVTAEYTGAAA